MKRAIGIMTKTPLPGKVKTRLIPLLGADEAANLYLAFLTDVLSKALRVPNCETFIFYYPTPSRITLRASLSKPIHRLPQTGADLGERMNRAFLELFEKGFDQVILLGADIPTLPWMFLAWAFDGLIDHDLTIGPSQDGGYYLIGMKKPHPYLFAGMTWGTSDVFQQTGQRAAGHSLSIHLLPKWYDVDTIDDLAFLIEDIKLDHPERLETFCTSQHTRDYINRWLSPLAHPNIPAHIPSTKGDSDHENRCCHPGVQ